MSLRLVQTYDLSEPLPFYQGRTLRSILDRIGGRPIEFGEVKTLPPEFDEVPALVYYLRSTKGAGQAECLWIDLGTATHCLAFNLGKGWRRTEVGRAPWKHGPEADG
jgi:hypothetical protein